MTKLKKLKYTGYKGGGCVPYLIANMTDSDIPIKGLEITETTSFDEQDASKMLQKAWDSRAYFKAILAEDRYISPNKEVKVLKWIDYIRFAKSSTVQQAKQGAVNGQLMVILLEVVMPNKNLHAIGLFYSPSTGDCIIIDPAKEKPISRDIALVFQIYRVLKVCPLFFEATKLVFYPAEGTRFLFEEVQKVGVGNG